MATETAPDFTLSVVIPTWCEATRIGFVVQQAALAGDEVLVVDADSPDGTAQVAREAGARVFRSGKGRGVQLHAGAEQAAGSVLLFLHADTVITAPATARRAIHATLEDEQVAGGNFHLLFEGGSLSSRVFNWANDARRRWLGVYYGDSGIFVRKVVYEQLGGFRPHPILEDYDFVRRLERSYRTSYLRHVSVSASDRRHSHAPLRTVCRWATIQGLYALGVAPERLARLYPDRR